MKNLIFFLAFLILISCENTKDDKTNEKVNNIKLNNTKETVSNSGNKSFEPNFLKVYESTKKVIDTGVFKNYYRYNVANYYFYNGTYENNLKFKIEDKTSKKVVYNYSDTLSDAMILKPKFFKSSEYKTILIMLEVAAEYSWGQEIILIKDKSINYLGYLDYAVDTEGGKSISNYCRFKCNNDKIFMSFEDVQIIHWPNESDIINGRDLRFEISHNKIKRIKY